MAASGHTYGRSCLLSLDFSELAYTTSDVSVDPPPIKAHFFYCSPLPIDDPLAPVPPPTNNVPSRPLRLPPRPFSVYDNLALEESWLNFHKRDLPKEGLLADGEEENAQITPRNLDAIAKSGEKAAMKNVSHGHGENLMASSGKISTTDRGRSRTRSQTDGRNSTLLSDSEQTPIQKAVPVTTEEISNDDIEGGLQRRDIEKKRSWSPFHYRDKAKETAKPKPVAYQRVSSRTQEAHEAQAGTSPSERDTTGTPFLRVPSRLKRSRSRSPEMCLDGPFETSHARPSFERVVTEVGRSRSTTCAEDRFYGLRNKISQISHVAVGVQQLHMVELPSLKMGPIYWDPVHDVASVIRGTWFYKETMWPVEAEVANQIEEGYRYFKPWIASYVDELNSCEGVGPEAELKLVHKIWPMDEPPRLSSRALPVKDKKNMMDTSPELDQQDRQRAKKNAACPENRAAGSLDGFDDPVRLFAKSSLIYANARDAQILQPNQLPSVARGRRPLAKIRKGRAVGIPVVRGFDNKIWEKLYPSSRQPATAMKFQEGVEILHAVNDNEPERIPECGACRQAERRKKPTDLILVIHGIGQKLSERVESFHFTHAINAFRRQVNLELDSDAVQPWLRQDLGGVTVLPVNWRSRAKLEERGQEPDAHYNDKESTQNQYTLKDITADSLPAVRSLISDVMLDIPYYLSHHKLTMIEAVIQEANHIYRLWCNRNPGFYEHGRVHLLAHSLGSVMALDVLSKQPTKLPKQLDFSTSDARSDMFEFDTKNLFLCGSPVGLFLLLEHAPLLPRKDRQKPEAETEIGSSKITGSVGKYGCLAVDNIYNVSHQFDPIAYKVNACVDVEYAASLKRAFVPSASASWAQLFSSVFRGKTVSQSRTMDGLVDPPVRPTTAKMPSTVEMEIHNFSREEIAERRMFLLNDNGQIDYILRTGGGPLEIQYLNMLSAHNAYWIMDDFVRFIVVETGRKPGRSQTLSNMKAVKKAWG